MIRLASILYSLIGSSMAGAAVIAVLVTGYLTVPAILAAAAAGAVVAMPVAYLVARRLYQG
jgi:putative flippase GtrA